MKTLRRAFVLHVELWDREFWTLWEPLPLDKKLMWIAFVSQTIAILTLLELFALHK